MNNTNNHAKEICPKCGSSNTHLFVDRDIEGNETDDWFECNATNCEHKWTDHKRAKEITGKESINPTPESSGELENQLLDFAHQAAKEWERQCQSGQCKCDLCLAREIVKAILPFVRTAAQKCEGEKQALKDDKAFIQGSLIGARQQLQSQSAEMEKLKDKLLTIESCASAVRSPSDALTTIQFIKGTINEND